MLDVEHQPADHLPGVELEIADGPTLRQRVGAHVLVGASLPLGRVPDVTSSLLENDLANEGGSAVFFVSNDMSGSITITDSITRNNPRGTFETPGLPGFYVIASGPANIVNSTIQR